MARTKLGSYLSLSNQKNISNKLGKDSVVGLSTNKNMIQTKADLDGVKLTNYKILSTKQFGYVADTSRRGEKISLAYNKEKTDFLVSSISTIFYVKDTTKLLPDYLFMYFNRPEFDRYARFNSWGSARETFTWEDLCDIEIELPDIGEQQKAVNIYNALLDNQKAYEAGADDLKLVCDLYIENLRREIPSESIGEYLEERVETNIKGKLENLKGIGINGFISPNQKRSISSLKKCNIFYKDDFVYAPSSLSNGVIDISKFDEAMICTEEYIVFYINQTLKLLPEYLLMWMKRSEFARRIKFNSIDSVRNRYYFKQLKEEISIPLPKIETQQAIVNIYNAYIKRKEISEKIKELIKDICPILIRGSLQK